MAVNRDNAPVLLHTHLSNRVARYLLEHKGIPGLETARVVRGEVPVGHSRFDFLLEMGQEEAFMEVKSVTLFGNGVAMFPDAVTERGRRHLLELYELARSGRRAMVLFLVHHPRVRWFMPDYHTDLAFSQTLLVVRRRVRFFPMAVGWGEDLSLGSKVKLLKIPWGYLRREVTDRGAYLLVMKLNRNRSLRIGQLGTTTFRRGYYVYVGSAMQNLSARIARHLRKRKKPHWHIDYFREHARVCAALPIRSSGRQECDISRAFAALLDPALKGFGSSDCRCMTHLFHSPFNPLLMRALHTVLERFRMKPPASASLE